MKLRVSLMAQATMAALRERAAHEPEEAARLHEDAGELAYIRSQPTADDVILLGLGAAPAGATA
jgi:hypothetical protein